MKYAVTVYFALFFLLSAPLYLAVMLLVWLVSMPFDPDRRAVHAIICRIGFFYFRVNPLWDVKVEGRERIPNEPCVLVANHQSMADVMAALGLKRQFKFVSKASLFGLPFVGWAMRLAGYMSLKRGLPHSTDRLLGACRGWLRRGMPVLLFPEGTYAPVGQMLPFKRGAFILAMEEKVPLVPVIIEGTRSLIIEDGPWLQPRCRIRIRVLPPLPAGELGTNQAELVERVRAQFLAELKLLPPTPG